MKRPRRKPRPEHSWDRLNGTRMEVLELPGGQVRRLCVNVADPMAAVVSFAVHALTKHTGDAATLRVLCVDNFNNDPREVFQIPEACAWLRRLWFEGAPLLRLLTECTGDIPPDDRLGLSQRAVSQLGLGWFDVYACGFGNATGTMATADDGGPAWTVAGTLDRPREEIRAELLQMSPGNPEGYTFDAAGNRRVFVEHNLRAAEGAAERMVAAGKPDSVVLVLSLLDSEGWATANALGEPHDIQAQLKRCRAENLHPAAVVGLPRADAGTVLDAFAPEAAKHISRGRPANGGLWAAFVAHEGTQLAAIRPDNMEGNK